MYLRFLIIGLFSSIASMGWAASPEGMEQCRVIVMDPKTGQETGLIKENEADGIGSVGIGNPYKGMNIDGERNAYIWVPTGKCNQINKGDFTGVSDEIKNKIYIQGFGSKKENVKKEVPWYKRLFGIE